MADFDIQALKDRLLVKYPAFASTIVNIGYYEKPVSTLCTDGQNIYYNKDYLNKLSFNEQLFIFAHEICHIRSNHVLRSKGKNHKLWNIATDAVINQLLKEDGLTMPAGVINVEEAINYSAEEYYDKLLKNQSNNSNEENQPNQNDSNSPSEDNTQGNASSSGSESKENQNESNGESKENNSNEENQPNQNVSNSPSENNTQGNASSSGSESKENQNESNGESKENNSNEESNNPSNVDDHSMWSKALENENNNTDSNQSNEESVNEKELFSQNRKEKIENLKKLKEELLKQSMKAGTTTNGEQFCIDDIGVNKSLIDWRIILKKAVNIKLRWDIRNPEVEYGVLVPKINKLAYPRTEILLDTSGTIDEEMLRNFLRECKYILQNSEMWVGCFDTKFYGFQKIKSEKDIENMTFYGRGGTNFDVAVSAFGQRVDNKIIFTDGYAHMPKEKSDIIWIVFGKEKINPPGGKVIYIDNEQLKRLKPSTSSFKK